MFDILQRSNHHGVEVAVNPPMVFSIKAADFHNFINCYGNCLGFNAENRKWASYEHANTNLHG